MSESVDLDRLIETALESHQNRRLDEAEPLYRQVLEADPDHVEALCFLALVLQDRGRAGDSIPLLAHAIDIDPAFADAHANLARGLRFLDEGEKAAAAARQALALDPDLGEAWLHLGYASLGLGRHREALSALREAAARFPDSPDLHAGIGAAARALSDHEAAADAWRTVLRLREDRIDALVNLGAALCQLNRLNEALIPHRRAVRLAPDDVTARAALAVTLHRRLDADELVAECREILRRAPERLDILSMLTAGLTWLGRFDEALETCRAILALQPDNPAGMRQLASLDPSLLDRTMLARFREGMEDGKVRIADRIAYGFAIAKALDRTGDHDAAFRMFVRANALDHAHHRETEQGFDAAALRDTIGWTKAAFTPSLFTRASQAGAPLAGAPLAGDPSETPVFVVGMPRSGTSLVEQILASHARVFGAGERKDLFELIRRMNGGPYNMPLDAWDPARLREAAADHLVHLRELAGGADRIVDKLPDNILFLGHIRLFFPNARIIVCHRDPRDVCVSCFTTHFGDGLAWSSDLAECAERAVAVENLMDHWRAVLPGPLLEINYEDLVADLETQSRRLIDFLGLDWDPACLSFHRTERSVSTASFQQVRQPLYDSSVGRWRKYETHLAPMLRVLGERGVRRALPDPRGPGPTGAPPGETPEAGRHPR